MVKSEKLFLLFQMKHLIYFLIWAQLTKNGLGKFSTQNSEGKSHTVIQRLEAVTQKSIIILPITSKKKLITSSFIALK